MSVPPNSTITRTTQEEHVALRAGWVRDCLNDPDRPILLIGGTGPPRTVSSRRDGFAPVIAAVENLVPQQNVTNGVASDRSPQENRNGGSV